MNINGLHIGIIGAVRSGVSAALLCKEKGGIPFVSDFRKLEEMQEVAEKLKSENIDFEFGVHSEKLFNSDLIITSPGVPTNSYPIQEALKRGKKVISEIEFAYLFCKSEIVAVTGTNGKTTTTSLISHILTEAGRENIAAGNIGFPFSQAVREISENGVIVLEVSSFQLDFVEKFKPNVAILLNITPDHMDRYENNLQKYIDSKMRIVENQTENDVFIFNAEDEVILRNLPANKSMNYGFSLKEKLLNGIYLENGKFIISENGKTEEIAELSELSLRGEHNWMNAMSAILASKKVGISNISIKKAISSFKSVEHRLELVKEENGIKFINDSKATNPDSTYFALRSFDGNIKLVLGGKDKGNDYSLIEAEVLKRVKKIYAIGSSAQKVYDYFKDKVEVELIVEFAPAIKKAICECKHGEVLLFSPACASFDQFNNYEERGREFKKLVLENE